MGMPTRYRTPRKNLSPRKIDKKHLRRWLKYRQLRGKAVRPPKQFGH